MVILVHHRHAHREARLARNALGEARHGGGGLEHLDDARPERAAREAGFAVGVAVVHKDHHAAYYPGARELSLKLVYDRKTARLLGAQAFGHGGVEKRIDVLATALQGRMTLHDLAELDLAYAPPYSSANDPVNVSAFVGLNDLSGYGPLVTADELREALRERPEALLLDVRNEGEFERSHVRGAMHLALDNLRVEWETLPRDRPIYLVCRSGFRAHLALRILKERGFDRVVNVTGGHLSVLAAGGFALEGTEETA